MLIDLSEAFSWVRSNDLNFQDMPKFGHPSGCSIGVKGNLKSHFHFIVLKDNLYFRVAEMITQEIDQTDMFEVLEPRHTSLVCADLKIPYNIPKTKDFIGPINEVNLLRILHLTQATMRKDEEMREQIIHDLNLSFPEEAKKETAPYRAGSNVVSLFTAGPARK